MLGEEGEDAPMGKQIIVSFLLIFLIFFLPWLWGGPAQDSKPDPEPESPPAGDVQPELEDHPQPDIALTASGADGSTMLNVLVGGKLQQMDMGTYLLGVVRASID